MRPVYVQSQSAFILVRYVVEWFEHKAAHHSAEFVRDKECLYYALAISPGQGLFDLPQYLQEMLGFPRDVIRQKRWQDREDFALQQ